MADRIFVDRLRAFLISMGAFGDDGKFNELGLELLSVQLSSNWLPERHGSAFIPIRRAARTPFLAVECVLVINGEIPWVWRVHPVLGTGWHIPGGYPDISTDMDIEDTVRRIAMRELHTYVDPVRQLITVPHFVNPRFPDAGLLYLCRLTAGAVRPAELVIGKPKNGDIRFFKWRPSPILPIQEDYWPHLEEVLLEIKKTGGVR